MKYYLGIDGGGTRTVAAVCNEQGEILCRAEGGSINFYSLGMECSRHNLSEILRSITQTLGDITFERAVIGCSALDSRASKNVTNELCHGIVNADDIVMDSDVYVALRASEGNAIAICGTGSIALGEKSNGELVVKGGWGHILGDEGSGYSIALSAVKHSCHLSDMGKQCSFDSALYKYFGVSSVREVIDVIYSPDVKKDFIAGFGAVVGALADNDDRAAQEIVYGEAASFVETVLCLLEEIGDVKKLSLYGGVFTNCNFFKESFCREIESQYPCVEISLLTTPPECGALNIARGIYE